MALSNTDSEKNNIDVKKISGRAHFKFLALYTNPSWYR